MNVGRVGKRSIVFNSLGRGCKTIYQKSTYLDNKC